MVLERGRPNYEDYSEHKKGHWLSIKQTRAYLYKTYKVKWAWSTLVTMIKRKRIPGEKDGGRWRINTSDIDFYMRHKYGGRRPLKCDPQELSFFDRIEQYGLVDLSFMGVRDKGEV